METTVNQTEALPKEVGPQAPQKAKPAKGKETNGGEALASLIFALQQLVMTFTGTMQVFQERFGQLSNQEAALAAALKKIPTNKKNQDKFQKEIMQYKQELNAVQNQQQLTSVAMQGASSNESTMLTMLGNVVKIYGNTLVAVAQAMSS